MNLCRRCGIERTSITRPERRHGIGAVLCRDCRRVLSVKDREVWRT